MDQSAERTLLFPQREPKVQQSVSPVLATVTVCSAAIVIASTVAFIWPSSDEAGAPSTLAEEAQKHDVMPAGVLMNID